MSYIVQADLLADIPNDVLIQLTDDNKDGSVDSSVVTDAITRAQSEVDGYLATKYSVPIAAPPQLVKSLTATLTCYRLFGRRGRGVPEDWGKRYDDAVRTLTNISKGLVKLDVEPPPAESSTATAGEIKGPERVFDRDKLGSF